MEDFFDYLDNETEDKGGVVGGCGHIGGRVIKWQRGGGQRGGSGGDG